MNAGLAAVLSVNLLTNLAQQVAIAPRLLTLPEAIDLAEQYSPLLRASSAYRDGAAASIITARAYPNPDVTMMTGPQFSRFYIRGRGPSGLLQHYSAGQIIETPLVRSTRRREAEFRSDGADYALSETRLGVRAATKQSFYEVLRRRSEVEVTNENLRLVDDLRRRIAVQVEVGEASRFELTRAEAEVATARTIARSAELRLVGALSALRAAVAAPLPERIELVGALEAPLAYPSLDEVRREVLANNPLIAMARADINRAQARLQSERAQRVPQPLVRGEFENQPDLGFYRFGVSLPVPFWNRREGPIAEAVAGVNQMQAIADQRRLELVASLERAYGQYQIGTQQVASFQEGVLIQAAAAVRAAEAAYRFGERGILEVLDAQRVLRSVNLDFLNAQYDRQAALIELERLRAGGPAVGVRP